MTSEKQNLDKNGLLKPYKSIEQRIFVDSGIRDFSSYLSLCLCFVSDQLKYPFPNP